MIVSGWTAAGMAGGAAIFAFGLYVLVALSTAARIGGQVAQAAADVDVVRAQMTSLDGGIDKINDSVDRILHMVRTLRKAVVDE